MPGPTPDSTTASVTAGELAGFLDADLRGDADARIDRVDVLENAGPTTLSFVRDASFATALAASDAGVVLVGSSTDLPDDATRGKTLLLVDDADHALIAVLEALAERDPHAAPAPGIDPAASVHPTADVHDTASVGPGAVIEAEASVGAHAVIGPGVVLRRRCTVGERVIVHPNAVIGADGFGYRVAPDGKSLVKIPHVGDVVIEEHAEIGAGACIDRGKLGTTRIGAGTKIDNLVQIGHNVVIGRCCVICGNAGIGGSTTVGDGVMIGGGAGIGDNVAIGDGAEVAAFAAVKDNIPPGEQVMGQPAVPRRDFVRMFNAQRKLPDLIKKMNKGLP